VVSEDRPRGDTDALARHHGEYQRTGGKARAVHDHALAGIGDALRGQKVAADLASYVLANDDVGERGRCAQRGERGPVHDMTNH
jgi:hypothetical protein